jgi:hypothetical protein
MILQRIAYYLFIGLSLIFLLGMLIGGYKYLDSLQKKEALTHPPEHPAGLQR